MLILLPPSEGKTHPASGPTLDLENFSSPELNPVREQLLNALVALSGTNNAMEILGVGASLVSEVEHNITLHTAPTARADEVYTGVLFSELDPRSLSEDARTRLDQHVAISSALFGLVRPGDLIPAYRMSGAVKLPDLGTLRSIWKPLLPAVITQMAAGALVVDLRSGTYVDHGPVPKGVAHVTVRVLLEKDGKRKVVSHFNKATKGRLVRQLLNENVRVNTAEEFVDALASLGHRAELDGNRVDVIVDSV